MEEWLMVRLPDRGRGNVTVQKCDVILVKYGSVNRCNLHFR